MTRRPLSLAVRLYRQDRGWTQTRLAEAMGIPQHRISEIETGRVAVTEAMIERLAAGYGMDPVVMLARAAELARDEIAPEAAHENGNGHTRNGKEARHETIEIERNARGVGSVGRERCDVCGLAPCYCGDRAAWSPWGREPDRVVGR